MNKGITQIPTPAQNRSTKMEHISDILANRMDNIPKILENPKTPKPLNHEDYIVSILLQIN